MFLLITFSLIKSLQPFPWRYDFWAARQVFLFFSHLADSNIPLFLFSHQQTGEQIRNTLFLRVWLWGLNKEIHTKCFLRVDLLKNAYHYSQCSINISCLLSPLFVPATKAYVLYSKTLLSQSDGILFKQSPSLPYKVTKGTVLC